MKNGQVLLGHANIGTTEVYLHSDQEELRKKIQAEEPPAPPLDPQVQVAAQVLASLTDKQREALMALLGTGA